MMKNFKIALIALALLCPLVTQAQSKEIKEKFRYYTENEIYKANNGNIVITSVIDNVPGSKEDIYISVKNFFARNYNDGNSVVQTEDKEEGIVIGKGIYPKFWKCSYMGLQSIEWSAFHILRVDIKEGKIRVMCSVSDMDYTMAGNAMTKTNEKYSYQILDYAPFYDKRQIDKGKQTEAVVHLIERMQSSINRVEKAVKSGVLEGENESW